MTSKYWRVIAVTIVITSALFRFYAIDRMSLWGDEACMMYLCQESSANIIEALASTDRPDVDVAPPLYFLLLRYWMKVLGTSVLVFRGFSAILGIGVTVAAIWLANEMFDSTIALITGWITALNPFQVWYSQEGRMYSLAAFLAVISIFFFVRMIKAPASNLDWLGFLIFSTSLIYTQYYGFLLMASLSVCTIFLAWSNLEVRRSGIVKRGFLTCVIWIVAYAPWFPILIRDYLHAGSPGGFPSHFQSVKSPVFLFVKMTMFGNENFIMDNVWLYPLPLLTFAMALLYSFKKIHTLGVIVSLFAVLGPFSMIYVAALAGLRVYKSHPFILFQIPLLILIAVGLKSMPKTLGRISTVIILAGSIFVTGSLSFHGDYVKPRTKEAVEWILKRTQPGDITAVLPAFLPNPMPIVGDLLAFKYHCQHRFPVQYLTGNSVTDVFQTIESIFPPDGRLFFVYQDNLQVHDQIVELKRMLNQNFKFLESQAFPSNIRGFSMGTTIYGQQKD